MIENSTQSKIQLYYQLNQEIDIYYNNILNYELIKDIKEEEKRIYKLDKVNSKHVLIATFPTSWQTEIQT